MIDDLETHVELHLPKVKLVKGRLSYVWEGQRKRWMAEEALAEFLALADAKDDEIVAYANEWGVLELCESHDLPATHSYLVPTNDPNPEMKNYCPPRTLGRSESEPTYVWREFAGHARGLLNVAAKLQRKEKVSQLDWSAVMRGNPRMLIVQPPTDEAVKEQIAKEARFRSRDAHNAWYFINNDVNLWISLAETRPKSFLTENGLRLRITAGYRSPLFGALGLALLNWLENLERLAWCASCGLPFVPYRGLKQGKKSFCKRCGIKAAWRFAAARHRAKTKEQND